MIKMYDAVVKNVGLSYDELELIKLSLERYQETYASRTEEYVIEILIEKLS